MTKIYFFTRHLYAATTRFRAKQYLSYFTKKGYETILFTSCTNNLNNPSSSSLLSILLFNLARYFFNIKDIFYRWQQINQIKDPNSIIYIHSFLTPFINTDYLAQVVRNKSSRMVLDMDDAIFAANKRTETKLRKLLPLCDAVIVGNEYLSKFAEKYQTNIHVIPTPIETNFYLPKIENNKQVTNTVTIGWMGSWVNLKHLNLILPSLLKLKSQLTNINIKIVTNILELPPTLKNIAQLKQWNAEDELKDLQSFDIGLMPLEDNLFTKGKCSFKLIQYMAVGIPVIASPVGMNKKVVKNNGFLCSSSEEWLESLILLCKDEELRKIMGKKSREIAEKEYSTKINFVNLHLALTGNDLTQI